MRVGPPLYEFEACHACPASGMETALVERLTLERGKETLAHGIIEAIADRAHRESYAGLAAVLAEGDLSVLANLVLNDESRREPTLPHGQVERLQHQFRAQMSLYCPATISRLKVSSTTAR
jgi:hypothetical protein